MNPERWQAAGDLFEQVIALPTMDQQAFVDARCGADDDLRREVASLLASHRAVAGGFIQERIQRAVASFYETHPPRVGPYRLIRELGRGGMGTVFLAERDDDEYRAQVAIKLVRPGMDTEFILARFRRERQTLARLQHPNISRLHDGGTAEGLPYIVMEYIDGAPITAFAGRQRLGLSERLRLFLPVCSAVDYAHRQFVVHRDLKPGNILVGPDGVPKLLDFGICKLLHSDGLGADTVAAPMTPNYASPEQIRGESATPLSDVYALGVVLYELLTGVCPRRFEKLTPAAVEQVLANAPVLPPSAASGDPAIARQLAGDLDNILLHALETEPQRRYESAAQLAEDVRRYLGHEPVRARPQTRWYRAAKFTRRHRAAIASAGAAFVTVTAGLGMSLYEQRLAAARLEQVRSLAERLVFDVHDAIRDLPGSTRAREMIVSTGLEYLDSLAKSVRRDGRTTLELAKAYRKLGDVQGDVQTSNLGATASALTSYRHAAALLDELLQRKRDDGDALTERLIVANRIGSIQAYTSQLRDAIQTFDAAIHLGAPFARAGSADTRTALGELYLASSDARRNLNEFEAALRDGREGLKLVGDVATVRASDRSAQHAVASAYAIVGMSEASLGHLQDGLGYFTRQVDAMTQLVAAEPGNVGWQRDLMMAYGHVADVSGNPGVANLGDRRSALVAYQHAAEIGKAIFEADHADQRAAADYGIVLSRVETVMDDADPSAKIDVQQRSLDVLDHAAAINPDNNQLKIYQAFVAQHLGDAWRARGDLTRAHDAYAKSMAIAEPAMRSGYASFAITFLQSAGRLALTAVARGHRREALDAAQQALDVGERGPARNQARGRAAMAFTYVALAASPIRDADDGGQAVSWLRKSLDAWRVGQSEPGFAAPHAREMREVQDALARMEKH